MKNGMVRKFVAGVLAATVAVACVPAMNAQAAAASVVFDGVLFDDDTTVNGEYINGVLASVDDEFKLQRDNNDGVDILTGYYNNFPGTIVINNYNKKATYSIVTNNSAVTFSNVQADRVVGKTRSVQLHAALSVTDDVQAVVTVQQTLNGVTTDLGRQVVSFVNPHVKANAKGYVGTSIAPEDLLSYAEDHVYGAGTVEFGKITYGKNNAHFNKNTGLLRLDRAGVVKIQVKNSLGKSVGTVRIAIKDATHVDANYSDLF